MALWSREQEDHLSRLWAGGSSASEIAEALPAMQSGRPITRDMVIGKARRLGLDPRASPIKRGTVQ